MGPSFNGPFIQKEEYIWRKRALFLLVNPNNELIFQRLSKIVACLVTFFTFFILICHGLVYAAPAKNR